MKVAVREGDGSARMWLEGRVDAVGAEDMRLAFMELNITRINRLIVDMAGVSFVGSACLGKLLSFHKTLSQHGGVLELANVPRPIAALLEATKLDGIFMMSGN